MVDVPYEYGCVTDTWIGPGTVGGETGPAYYTFDVSAKYTRELPVGKLEFFLDLFNIFDKQSAITEQDLIAGDGVYAFGQATDWVESRRANLGGSYSFCSSVPPEDATRDRKRIGEAKGVYGGLGSG